MWSDIGYHEDITEDNLLHNLKRVFSGARACKSFLDLFSRLLFNILYIFLASWKSPLYTLRAFFFHLRDPKRLETLHHGLLEVLQFQPEEACVIGGGSEGGVIDTPSGSNSLSLGYEDTMHIDMDGQDNQMGVNGVDERMKRMKENFRFSVSTHLFGWDELLRLRMRLSLADFVWVRYGSSFLRLCIYSRKPPLTSISILLFFLDVF